jgi:hypothetical protein
MPREQICVIGAASHTVLSRIRCRCPTWEEPATTDSHHCAEWRVRIPFQGTQADRLARDARCVALLRGMFQQPHGTLQIPESGAAEPAVLVVNWDS